MSDRPPLPHKQREALATAIRVALPRSHGFYNELVVADALVAADAAISHLHAAGLLRDDAGLSERIQQVAAQQVQPPHILNDAAQRVWLAGRDAGIAAVSAALRAEPGTTCPDCGRPDPCPTKRLRHWDIAHEGYSDQGYLDDHPSLRAKSGTVAAREGGER
jgi:hypothetical protein